MVIAFEFSVHTEQQWKNYGGNLTL